MLANSITSGLYAERHVPENIRHIILAESGANDGLGFPFFFIALYLMMRRSEDYGESIGQEIWRWFYSVVVYQILLSIAYGTLMGYVARKTLRWASNNNLIDMSNFFSYGFGLAVFTLGTAGLFGTDDILACFVAGNSFTWDDWFRLRLEGNDFQEIIDMIFNTAIFMYIGALIPWNDYSNGALGLSGWRVVVLGICVILLRRMPWMILAHRFVPVLRNWNEAMFTGWFGPIGVSAVYYIQVALRKVPDDHTRQHLRDVVTPVVMFCVFSSVLTHGVTIPFTYYGKHFLRETTTFTQFSLGRGPAAEPDLAHMTVSQRMRYYFQFWAKNSFWRSKRTPTAVDPKSISGPSDPRCEPDIEGKRSESPSRDVDPTLHSDAALEDEKLHQQHVPHMHHSPVYRQSGKDTSSGDATPPTSPENASRTALDRSFRQPQHMTHAHGALGGVANDSPYTPVARPEPAITIDSFRPQ